MEKLLLLPSQPSNQTGAPQGQKSLVPPCVSTVGTSVRGDPQVQMKLPSRCLGTSTPKPEIIRWSFIKDRINSEARRWLV